MFDQHHIYYGTYSNFRLGSRHVYFRVLLTSAITDIYIFAEFDYAKDVETTLLISSLSLIEHAI